MMGSNKIKIQIVFAPLPEEERDVERSAAMEFAVRTAEQFRNDETTATMIAAAAAAATMTPTTTSTTTTDDVVEICHLADWDKNKFMASLSSSSPKNSNDDKDVEDNVIGGGNNVIVFLISCGPDGSVHRSVRKTTKWLKEEQQQQQIKSEEEEQSNNTNHQEECPITAMDKNETKTTLTTTTAVVALLGHSVCKTSAEQMADEVFSSGRRLAKSIQNIIIVPTPSSMASSSSATAIAPKFLLETQIELEPPEEKFDGWVESILGSVIATAGKI